MFGVFTTIVVLLGISSAQSEDLAWHPGESQLKDDFEWEWHSDNELGFQIEYPEGWRVVDRPPLPDLVGDTIFIGPQSHDGLRFDHLGNRQSFKVMVGHRSYLKPLDQSLEESTLLHLCKSEISTGSSGLTLEPWPFAAPEEAEEVVYVRGDGTQYLHVSRGTMVWFVMANFGEDNSVEDQIFETMARSLQFDEGAPMSYEELYGHVPGEIWFPDEKTRGDCLRRQTK